MARQEKNRSTRKPGDKFCGAEKNKGGTCKLGAGHGTDHAGTGRCKFHGGSNPSGKAAAAKELAVLKAIEMSATTGVEIDPGDALLASLYSAVGLTNAARDAYNWHLDHVTESTDMGAHRGAYEDALDRQARLAELCLRAGIAERQVRAVERQGDMVLSVMRSVLDDLGVPMSKALPVLRKRLGQMASGVIEIEETNNGKKA